MRHARFDHLLAGAAVALALAVTEYAPLASAQSKDSVEAAMPSADAPTSTGAASAATNSVPAGAAASDALASSVASVAKPLPAVPLGDAAVADKLREMSSGKFDRILGGKRDRGAIEPFYADRNFAPLWINDGSFSQRAKAAAAYLSGIAADGLDPSDYPLPQVKPGADPDALAEAELRFTDAVVTYARHAQIGRVHFSRVASDIQYELVKPEPADVLAKLATAQDIGETLDSYNPPQPGYKALKAKLAEARNRGGDGGRVLIASGPVLRYGKDKKGNEMLVDDPRVPQLRERLDVPGDRTSTTYDHVMSEAVATFQKSNGLRPNGQLNAETVDAINGPRRDRDADVIIANMERWRWIPRDLGRTYVMVNIPDYTLRVVRDNKLVWTTRVVVGKPNLATPMISADMKFITVNPTWNVPPSIIQNEYLPALQQDPQALERIGLKIEQNRDGTVRIWQPPGDKNALGRIRFNFPNKFLVYQHDTPDKHLFAHDKRAYSHGCMRVQDPVKYGEVLLSLVLPQENYTQERLRKMFGGGEININFPTFIPVHITYQTAFVDDAGKLQIREDIYGRDARTLAALKGDQRKVADTPVERQRTSSSAPVRMPPGSFGGGLFSGPSFFDRLFGGSDFGAPPPRRVGRANDRRSVR